MNKPQSTISAVDGMKRHVIMEATLNIAKVSVTRR